MQGALYMHDAYLKEFDAVVESVKDGKYVVLDKTAFYPNGGGQPYDAGILKDEANNHYKVVFVGKFDGKISHEVDKPGLNVGAKVHGIVDWQRRYKLMRMHTAAHILSGVIEKDTGALISGNQLDADKSRLDFNLDNYQPEKIPEWIGKANKVIDDALPITVSFMEREEAMKDPSLFKLAKAFSHEVKQIRIVDIVGFIKEADGGTHVNSTKEVGHLKFIKSENKGKNNRRIYFELLYNPELIYTFIY